MSTQSRNKKLVIIGAGPAGLMAAIYATRENPNLEVIIIEKNEKIGKKLYITGKGRCNLCNDCPQDEFLANIVRNPKFMFASLKLLPPAELRNTIEQLGCETKVERGKRVFPKSEKSSDIIKALKLGIENTKLMLNTRAESLIQKENEVVGIKLDGGKEIYCDAVIVATGGLSYPVTGSTGDGYIFAQKTGHNVIKTSPSLVSIELKDSWIEGLSGLSLKNVKLSVFENDKKLWSGFGEMLFTHNGISGPLVLSASANISGKDLKNIKLFMDMKPALSEDMLTKRLIGEFAGSSKKLLYNIFPALLPKALAERLPEIMKINCSISCSSVDVATRNMIIKTLKNWPLSIKSLGGYQEAVVTRGGVDVKDVNPSSLKSKKAEGLFFAGETLDIDAYTGGFNLQIAFSTGALAGKSAARYILNKDED